LATAGALPPGSHVVTFTTLADQSDSSLITVGITQGPIADESGGRAVPFNGFAAQVWLCDDPFTPKSGDECTTKALQGWYGKHLRGRAVGTTVEFGVMDGREIKCRVTAPDGDQGDGWVGTGASRDGPLHAYVRVEGPLKSVELSVKPAAYDDLVPTLRPDANEHCMEWAAQGECINNPAFMLPACPTSCAPAKDEL